MEEASKYINIISFTEKGEALAKRLSTYLFQSQQKDQADCECDRDLIKCISKCRASKSYSAIRLSECAKESFEKKQGMIFIGAAGIAVRTIAPFLKDKLHDPILSGHVGRANEYARKIAAFLNAQAVITTATDVSHCFAADLFAQKNNYVIQNKEGIARVSAKTLARQNVTVHCENRSVTLSFEGTVLKEESIEQSEKESEKKQISDQSVPEKEADIIISPFIQDGKKGSLWLVPRCIVVGVGCRRKKEAALIKQTIFERLAQSGIAKEAVCQITSIDRKKDEAGLIETAADFNVEFVTFTEEKLRQVPGNFSSSAFVEKTVGVDNVCERSAMAAAPQGILLARKYAKDGVTVAIAMHTFFPVF